MAAATFGVLCMQSAQSETGIALAGADVSAHSSYSYVGSVFGLGHPFSEGGFVGKVWADYLRYDFLASNTKVGANATGLQLAGGYQWLRPGGYTSVYLGLAARDTRLPAGVQSAQRGTLAGVAGEIDFSQAVARATRLDAILNYAARSEDYWSRARLMNRAGGAWSWGPELVAQGNPEYSAYRAGLAVADIPLYQGRAHLEASTGYAHTRDIGGGAYANIGLAIGY